MPHALAPRAEQGRPLLSAAVTNDTWDHISNLPESTAVPAGHAFELYCPVWADRPHFESPDKGKRHALAVAAKCNADAALADAIAARTTSTALGLDKSATLSLPLVATSALITGSGIDHPTENGFAFMRPYGAPFIAGSGIKGALRAAAENKALFDPESGWSMADVWWLFGWESQADYWKKPTNPDPEQDRSAAFSRWLSSDSASLNSAAKLLEILGISDPLNALKERSLDPEKLSFRGLLDFWDMPLPNATPSVDVMTPHYSSYYQGKGAPNETDDPLPIFFLVMAPGATGRMTLQWQGNRPGLGDIEPVKNLKETWRTKLEELILDLIRWDGLGAKTAVGYGRFKVNQEQIEADETHVENAQQAIKEKEQSMQAEQLKGSMGEEQYAIFELREQFHQQKLEGTDAVNELIRTATDTWEESDRRALAELAREIYKSIKVGKKPQEKRKKLLQGLVPEEAGS